MTRESSALGTWNATREGMLVLINAGHHFATRRLGCDDQMNSCRRAPWLSSRDGAFHIGRRRLHQVGELVND